MNSAWFSGYPVGALAVPWLASRETTALILAVISFLFFRTFRERYLLTWGMGWITYAAFLFMERRALVHAPSAAVSAVTSAEFVFALGLFATAVLLSVPAKRLLTGMLMVCSIVVACAVLRPLYLPDSFGMRIGVEAGCRVVAALAVFGLLRYRLGSGPWYSLVRPASSSHREASRRSGQRSRTEEAAWLPSFRSCSRSRQRSTPIRSPADSQTWSASFEFLSYGLKPVQQIISRAVTTE
jgi:hypothetical protein